MITKEQIDLYQQSLLEQRKEAELEVLSAENQLETAKRNRDAIIGAQQALDYLICESEKLRQQTQNNKS